MKRDQIIKNVGWRVRIRPPARRPNPSGELAREDDDWSIQAAEATGLRIENVRTKHGTLIGYDNIHHFSTDPARDSGPLRHGVLQLRIQIFIHPDRIETEPLLPGKWDSVEAKAGAAELPKVRVRRLKENIPEKLPRITSGKQILDLFWDTQSHDFDHSELTSTEEAALIGGFLDLLKDCGDNQDIVGFSRRAELAVELTREIAEIERAGFAVYCAREKQILTVDGKDTDTWHCVILRVVRAS